MNLYIYEHFDYPAKEVGKHGLPYAEVAHTAAGPTADYTSLAVHIVAVAVKMSFLHYEED